MATSSDQRLGRALTLADSIAAALPPPKEVRQHRLQPRFTDGEMAAIQALADKRGEPSSLTVRYLALAALAAIATP